VILCITYYALEHLNSSVPGSAWDGSEAEALPSFRAQAEPGREGVKIMHYVLRLI
jgi:hypothetical protein